MRRRLSRKSTTANCSAVDQCSCLITFPDLSLPPNWICGGINRMACLLVFTTENRTITCWPPSRTSLMPARSRSPFASTLSGRSPYSTGMGACFWRSSKLSSESGLGWVGTVSTGELAVVSEAGDNAAPVPEALATDETAAACVFDTLAVCATSAKGAASGSTRKPPDGWYRSRKSTFAEFGPAPLLTRRKLIWRPLAVEINKLLSACSLVRALTNTSSSSCSECSTWKSAGSPTTTEFTASGTRIAVTKCAASSITVISLSAEGLVRTCGTMVVCCAPAVTISTASDSQPKTKVFLIPSPQLSPLARQLAPCPKHSSYAIPLRDPFDVALNIAGGILQSPRNDRALSDVVGCGNQSEVAVEFLFEPGKICDSTANVLLHQKPISHAEPHSGCRHQLHDSRRALAQTCGKDTQHSARQRRSLSLGPGAQADNPPIGEVCSGDQKCKDHNLGKPPDCSANTLFGCAPQGNGAYDCSETICHGRQEESDRPPSQIPHSSNRVSTGQHDDHNPRCQAQHRRERPQSHGPLCRAAALFAEPTQQPERRIEKNRNYREHEPSREGDLNNRKPRGDLFH